MTTLLDAGKQPSPSAQRAGGPQRIGVTLVEARACHFCEAARGVIDRVAEDFPLDLTVVSSRSERGVALVQRHRASMLPLVLVEDRFVSNGRLSEKLFRKRVGQAAAARAVA